MSALVPHLRPTLDTSGIRSGMPVTGNDWGRLAGLANWCNGHGGMLIPWTGIGYFLDDESATLHFYVGPKARAVERVWRISLSGNTGSGGSGAITVTAGGAAAVTFTPASNNHPLVYEVRERLTAKTSTAAGTSIAVGSAEGGTATVHAVAMYEETRSVLLTTGTDDYGCDLTSIASRAPLYDAAGRSIRGASDGYKNLDARRAGIFHWATSPNAPLLVTQVGYTDLFPLYAPALGAIVGTGTTTTSFKCAAYAKVNAGSGNIRFSSTQAGSNVVLAVTSTSFGWVTGDLTINAEDLTAADGRRSAAFETCRIEAQKDTSTTLSIAALSIIRTATTPV